jgi:hypothetical protein
MLIGTGQTAITGTTNLKKLEGRFPVKIELSDSDVEDVVRKVILEKRPEARKPLEDVMRRNIGEISRHLAGTSIGHRQDDMDHLVEDYPLLPVRRRLWDRTLRALDRTGTDSQLRNQLSMVHQAAQSNLDKPLGNVIPVDFLFFESANRLLHSGVLPKILHEKTIIWRGEKASETERLMARVCAAVFLINRLGAADNEIGVKATANTIVDFLLEDLSAGSGELRKVVPGIADGCELLMKIGDEYRIQTPESSIWNDEFQINKQELAHDQNWVATDREDRIKDEFTRRFRKSTTQGDSKVPRDLRLCFDEPPPADAGKGVCVWVRNGWRVVEKDALAEAIEAGNDSPTIHVFIPRLSADALHQQLSELRAAENTLDNRGVPATAEGVEARSAMETRRNRADREIAKILTEAFDKALIFKGGGDTVAGDNTEKAILKAAEASHERLFPKFHLSDQKGWDKVYTKAKAGAPDALKEIDYHGEPADNQVMKAIMDFLAQATHGKVVRDHFSAPPYGWSRDCVDGALQTLLTTDLVIAKNESGRVVKATELERKSIGNYLFETETATITAQDRLKLKSLIVLVHLPIKHDDDSYQIAEFLDKIDELRNNAGGEPPKPEVPDGDIIDKIRLKSRNEQLITITNAKNEWERLVGEWREKGDRIFDRWPDWLKLREMAYQAKGLDSAVDALRQVDLIESERQLLNDPDPVKTLLSQLAGLLREETGRLDLEFASVHDSNLKALEADGDWAALEPEQRERLLAKHDLAEAARPVVKLKTNEDLLSTLKACPISRLREKVAALPGRFDQVASEAARLAEPEIKFVELPSGTFKSEDEIDRWLNDVKILLKVALQKGPIKLR